MKKVYTYSGGAWGTTPRTFKYVWSSWLMLMELEEVSGQDQIVRKYTWGLDLAGQNGSVNSLEGAGGIGGLLAMHDEASGDNYLVLCDANGNVGQLIAWAENYGGTSGYTWGPARLVASYEYDPYGNLVSSSGTYADENLFRFSSKYYDGQTDSYYFGYRYYVPGLGRWINRDPIGEPGAVLVRTVASQGFVPRDPIQGDGPNHYWALRNDPIQRVDPDGGQSISFPGVGPIGPGGPRDWPPGVPYPPIPIPPPPSPQPRTQDLVYLHCYEPFVPGMYHCDVECLPTSGPPVIGGGTGPESSGGHAGPGGNPGWIDKPGVKPGSIGGGWTYAPAGTCACIKQKAAKMNQIIGKEYQFPNPCRPKTSNSNAMLSTLLRCCGVSMKPTRTDWVTRDGKIEPQYSDISAPGWGDSVLYQCGSRKGLPIFVDTVVGTFAFPTSIPCFCPVTCDMLN